MRLEGTYVEHHPNFGEGRLYADHGYVHYGVDKRRSRVFIHNISVDASHQKQGIGSALLDAVATRYPDHDMDLGYTTDAGEALWQSWLRKRGARQVESNLLKFLAEQDRKEQLHEIANPKWDPPAFDDGTWRAKHDQDLDHFHHRVRQAAGLSEDTPKYEVNSTWEKGMQKALANGHVDIDTARERGFSGDQRMTGWEGPYDWDKGKSTRIGGYRPLPKEAYHTTTGLSSVRREGLRTPDDLGHKGGHGLGGAASAGTISVTTDKDLAHDIYHSLHERHAFLNGKMGYDDLINDHHGGAPQEKIRDAVNRLHLPGAIEQWKRGMTSEGDRDPEHPAKWVSGPEVGIHTEDEFKQQYGNHWRLKPDTPGIRADFPDGQKHYVASEFERPVTEHEERDHREAYYKSFSYNRAVNGGHRDPLFISTDPHAFAAKDPKDIGILTVHPQEGAQGYTLNPEGKHDTGPDSGEWRTHSGEKLKVARVEQPTPRHEIERGTYKTALRSVAMNGPDEMPPKMGESPIPEGMIRCYHNTWGRHIPGIRENGLLESHAKGDGGLGAGNEPSAGVWAATGHPAGDDKMRGPHVDSDRHTVEFWAHPDQISTRAEHHWNDKPEEWGKGYHHVIMNGDVPSHQIVAIHEPWHSAARYMADSEDPEKEYGWIRDNNNPEFTHYKKGLDYLTRPKRSQGAAEPVLPGQEALFEPSHKHHLPNPIEGGHDWHHGTPKDVSDIREKPDNDIEEDHDYESDNNRHWNSYLGDHWTSVRGVADTFAEAGYHHKNDSDKGTGTVFTGNLRMRNPKVYHRETRMDSEAVHHSWPNSDFHDPQDFHAEHCSADEGGPCQDGLEAHNGDDVETKVRNQYATAHNAAHWLGTHPDKENIAWNFQRHLREQGHDGIVYGNEVEGPGTHPCAITFDPHQAEGVRRSAARRGDGAKWEHRHFLSRPHQPEEWHTRMEDSMGKESTKKVVGSRVMYRGERPDSGDRLYGDLSGRFFTPHLDMAKKYVGSGHLYRLDLPEDKEHWTWAQERVLPKEIADTKVHDDENCPNCQLPHGLAAKEPLPHERMFGPTKPDLDPRLFDGDELKPEVRLWILDTLDTFWRPRYGEWRRWAHVYFAGSEASHWWGNNDFDVLVGIKADRFVQNNPQFSGLDETEICSVLNGEFREILQPQVEGHDGFEVTFYCNPGSWDIRPLKPYAAYDVTHDEWAVPSPNLPNNSPEDFDPRVWDLVDKYADRVRRILAMPPGERRRSEADALYQYLHSDRQRAFSPRGKGWRDPGNAVYKALDMHPDHLLKGLIEARH